MRNLKIRVLVLLCSFFIFSCAHKEFKGKKYSDLEKNAPGWIDGSSIDFPSDRYFVGVGVSSTGYTMSDRVSSSKAAARAEIAKIFKVKLRNS